MDGYTRKKVVGGVGLSRSSGLSLRDVNHEGRSFQCCNRIGCSTRQNSVPNLQSTVPEKPKFLKPPIRFKNNISSAASSSRSFSSTSNFRKYYHERQNQAASMKEAYLAESSYRQAETGENLNWESGFDGRIETRILNDNDRPILQRFSTTELSSTSNATSASRYGKQISRRFGSAIQDTASSFLRRSSKLRCGTQVPKTSPPVVNGRQQRYSLNNLGCASISDVLPSGSSNGVNSRVISVRRKLQEGEGSSKTILAQPERQVPQEASRQTRNHTGRDIAVSVRTRHHSSGIQNRRIRLSEPEYESTIQLADPLLFPQPSHAPISAPEDVQESSQNSSFTGRSDTGSRSSQTSLLSGSEDSDDYRRFNIEGIAEILLALERIEQDEELTDEQLLVLEANLFLGGLNFYDQHRDMRLDIDNMTYEELLALEEEMGTVSTALSEEAISKCLKRSMYRSNFTFPRIFRQGDDLKCSICQEEYVIGEEVGSLSCEHRFHVECIGQWLRLKNWCPICKAAAAAAAASFKSKSQS
ncbi:E3 ubiquitin-protein ligase MBR2 isoform X1 [Dendrobium catenatum]|uniref:RING-type E3 ubiquitin transferase n=1 Tax=Dendrobium catenatum TaxID=906689 RepID=A0A2I0W1T7_9ASPA|nr:E3 ubiquitin-protein ligase MBR2 isoform X1 [Dendrobium catenatum]XP_020698821.1 E3 ubiquitin-protein ligase MBR2 isoform X1 [Dendrobium catenatum]XP_020698830.1 E3 ubiquitin-protein ligase MBR2 isoform X1 [Dendrobium catenatum]XP_028554825.1 E3 ubiquitin-protein ligase MBR2 isoform X1 [Dendrobium catenatum]PKU69598.1 E3 ubiquitin ligase BIG BROTHER [Dendrobium catenatum]